MNVTFRFATWPSGLQIAIFVDQEVAQSIYYVIQPLNVDATRLLLLEP